MDFLFKVQVLLPFSNLKLNLLLCLDLVNYFSRGLLTLCMAILIFLPSLANEMSLNIVLFSSKRWRKIFDWLRCFTH